jgi:Calcineurin-like phosphoesterase
MFGLQSRLTILLLLVALLWAGGDPSSPSATAQAASGSAFPGTVLLGRPTDSSVALSLMSGSPVDVYVEYGAVSGQYPSRTAQTAMKAGTPVVLTLTGLPMNAASFYRIRYRTAGTTTFRATVEQSLRTQRSTGSSFTFAVEADPHVDVDRKMQPALFRQELANVLAGRPDFLVDLGDTFLGDKFATSYAQLAAQYANVRNYFGIVGPSVPLFLVNGNHEGEAGWLLDGTANNLSVWAANARKLYYPVPTPGGFYTGSTASEPFVGVRSSYYAWEWGDALFVVLDPYSYTSVNPKQSGNLWDYTLGEGQYRWLANVLSASTARYKFVFSHHVLGDVRGGVEWAGLYEWGGSAKNGAYQFDVKRPGWPMPIHDLFVRYGVTIFFQGHDHLFVRQDADGVVYQEVTQPASPSGQPPNADAYTSGVVLGGTGHLNVTVASGGVTVDYIRSSVTTKGGPAADNGRTVYSYTVAAN